MRDNKLKVTINKNKIELLDVIAHCSREVVDLSVKESVILDLVPSGSFQLMRQPELFYEWPPCTCCFLLWASVRCRPGCLKWMGIYSGAWPTLSCRGKEEAQKTMGMGRLVGYGVTGREGGITLRRLVGIEGPVGCAMLRVAKGRETTVYNSLLFPQFARLAFSYCSTSLTLFA